MGREFELKYKASPQKLAQIRDAFTGFAKIRMETTYYDNPAGEFGRLHWTLRRRMENETSVCTLKTNLPDGSRAEWEVRAEDILAAVPMLIAAGAPAALAEMTTQGVHPTCGARFTRLAAPMTAGESTVELALDEGVLLGGGNEIPLAEVEVELKSGTDADAVAFAALLASRYGLAMERKSKLRRALEAAGITRD